MKNFTFQFAKKISLIIALTFVSIYLSAQTNPTPWALSSGPFIFDYFFNTAQTTYPVNMQGWSGVQVIGAATAPTTIQADGDEPLSTNLSTANPGSSLMTNRGVRGIGIKRLADPDAGRPLALALALNTVGQTQVIVSWTGFTFNDNAANTGAIQLQYRVGTSGNWTDVIGSNYEFGASGTSQNIGPHALPAGALNQPIVQLRWVYYIHLPNSSGDGAAISYIYVNGCAGATSPADGVADNFAGTWMYKVPVTVTEQNNVSSTNFQVPVYFDSQSLIAAGQMNSNCADLRFGNCDLSIRYNYWIESGINTASTKVWVTVPSLPALSTATFFMHYGNASAPAVSSFDNTFPPSTRLIIPSCSTTAITGTNNYSWFEVKNGGTAQVSPDGTPVVINARKIVVTGVIDGVGAGYGGGAAGQTGAGPANGGGKGGDVGIGTGGGGGAYGGNGGNASIATGTFGNGGTAYGNTSSIDMGAGGGGPAGGGAGTTDGNGGGSVTLKAREAIISGVILLNGNRGTSITQAGFGGGGGAGGGFLLNAYSTTLTGKVYAKGGPGGSGAGAGGGGGGGRINLFSQIPFTPGTYDVTNGLKGVRGNTVNAEASDGSPGTVFTGTYSANEPIVNIIPAISISASATTICQGTNITFIATTGYSNYQFYVNATPAQNGPGNTFNTSSLNNGDVVKVLATYNACVITSNLISITVNPLPNANAGPDVSICSGSSTTLLGSGNGTYAWSPSTGLSCTTCANPVANPNATTTYTLTVVSANCGTDTSSVTVSVGALPSVNAGPDVAICDGSSTPLNASGSGTFAWSPATGLSCTNCPNPVAGPAATTTYTVTINDVCGTASDDIMVTVNSLPTANAGGDAIICAGDSTQLNASGGTSYAWNGTNGLSNPSIANPMASPASSTTYTVTVTDANGCSANDDVMVTVNQLPVANAGSDVSLCSGDSTQLMASGGTGFLWNTSFGLSDSTISNPMAGPASSTTYTVTVTDGNGCSASDDIIVYVNTVAANAGSDAIICSGDSTQLNASGGTSYAWNTTNGLSNPSIANPMASPASSTTYTVTVTDANGCSADDEVMVTVNPLPSANAGSDAIICSGDSTQLSASGGTSYAWNATSGLSNPSIANPMASPASSTTYTVTVTDANGCSADDEVMVTVNSLPTANAGSDAIICAGDSTQLNASGGTSYVWNGTNGLSNPGIANPMASPTSSTTYTATVTDANGCSAYDEVMVTVNALPLANAGTDVTMCNGDATTLNASGGTAYLWSPSAGLSCTNCASPVANPTSNITYTVTVTDANSCSATDDVSITLTSSITANAGPDASICSGTSMNLNASGGTGYSWIPSTNLSCNTCSGPVANPTVTITYSVIVSSGSCTADTDQVMITVNALPLANAGSDVSICYGDSAQLNASGGTNYLWSSSSGLSDPNISNPMASPGSSTTYTVTVTDANGCSASDDVMVTVNSTPTANAGADVSICSGDSSQLSASGGTNYMWSPSTGLSNQNISNPVAQPTSTVNYVVTVSDANGCTASDSVVVNVLAAPATPTITQNGNILTSSAGVTYQWYYNSVLISGATNQSYVASQNGVYSVCITDINGCSACSAPYNVTTIGVIENVSAGATVNVFPNPGNGVFAITVDAEWQGEFTIEVLNLEGEIIYSKKQGRSGTADKEMKIDISEFPSGIYFLKMYSNNKTAVQKLIKQ